MLSDINGDCKFLNFQEANSPVAFDYNQIRNQLLLDEGEQSAGQRWVCLFQPYPHFFRNGIDMDDVLTSNPASFRVLRAFWKLSFIKIDDDENQALIDIIVRHNQQALSNPTGAVYFSNYLEHHNSLIRRLNANYVFTSAGILSSCANGTRLSHEMAIEAGLLYQLSRREPATINTFGEWDYLSHQVIASPFKPIDYMDKMDAFGYSCVQGFNRTRSKYLVAELKKDYAVREDVDQVMKYVDWVKDEYSYGDYSMIRAFLIAHDFSEDIIPHRQQVGQRQYIIGRRPARSDIWSNLKLVRYSFNSGRNLLEFQEFENH